LLLALALLPGCATHPITGRDQILALPAVQAVHAEVGFALSAGARRFVDALPCALACASTVERARFAGRVETIGARLNAEARDLSPELAARIGNFQFEVSDTLGTATGSSASGRIALGSGLVPLAPTDTETSFLLAREMAHVIARHAEEDSGASLLASAVGHLLLPGVHMIVRLVATTVGSLALKGSWAMVQQREADEIAIHLLQRTGTPVFEVALDLQGGAIRRGLPDDSWGAAFLDSARHVAQIAVTQPLAAPGALMAGGAPEDALLARNDPPACPGPPIAASAEIFPALCALADSTSTTNP